MKPGDIFITLHWMDNPEETEWQGTLEDFFTANQTFDMEQQSMIMQSLEADHIFIGGGGAAPVYAIYMPHHVVSDNMEYHWSAVPVIESTPQNLN